MKSATLAIAFFPALGYADPSPSFDYTKIEVSALRFCDTKSDEIELPDPTPRLMLFQQAMPQAMPRHVKTAWNMPHILVDDGIDYKTMVAQPDSSIGYSLIIKDVDLSSSREVSRKKQTH